MATTPQGSISFIKKGWGGRTGDKTITENAGFLSRLCLGDTVMADLGFIIAKMPGSFGESLKIPAFFKDQSQVSALNAKTARIIANVWINV